MEKEDEEKYLLYGLKVRMLNFSKAIIAVDDYGSVCNYESPNNLTKWMPVEHTAICGEWEYDKSIKEERGEG